MLLIYLKHSLKYWQYFTSFLFFEFSLSMRMILRSKSDWSDLLKNFIEKVTLFNLLWIIINTQQSVLLVLMKLQSSNWVSFYVHAIKIGEILCCKNLMELPKHLCFINCIIKLRKLITWYKFHELKCVE